MKLQHHPDCSTLMAYASGTLSEALSIVVACHVAWCPECQRELRRHEETGGAMIDCMDAVPVQADCFKAVLQRIDAECLDSQAIDADTGPAPSESYRLGLPRPLCRLLRQPLDELEWKRIASGVSIHRIPLEEGARGKLLLVRIAEGRGLPRHSHMAGEITMVLRGAYQDETGRFAVGDIADLGNDVEHQPITEPNADCICLVGLEQPWRFKGLLLRLMQPLLRI